jgi:aspartyl-tRNA(Asn)/glutamyl-tRNA(Gln) amidotransferase subunit A
VEPKQYSRLSARQIAAGIRAKQFSATEITRAALERAHALDPKLHAFISILDDMALAAAAQVDSAVAAGRPLGRLAGVPVGLKDNLCLKGAPTTCASNILKTYQPPYTATAVQRLLGEGAIPLGKLNLDEFAMGSSTENSAFFTTRNPWDITRVPGGSSGGSAAAVAARILPLTLGSDTGGSIRQPAAFCGVLGLKPTYGRVSRYGLVAFASSLDQIGPLARNAADAALLTAVISGHDPRDATSANTEVPAELFELAAPAGLAGIKLGVPKEYFIPGTEPGVDQAVKAAIEVFRNLGAEIVEISLPHTEHAIAVYYLIATAEASSNLARYDGMHYGHRTAEKAGLVETYAKSRAEGFGAEVARRIMLGTYALSAGYYDAYYLRAQKVRSLIRADFDAALAQADALICPTTPTVAFKIGSKTSDPLSMYLSDIFTISANLAALPGLAIPCGFTAEKLPVGLQLLGRRFDELGLLKLAAAYEAKTGHHLIEPGMQ